MPPEFAFSFFVPFILSAWINRRFILPAAMSAYPRISVTSLAGWYVLLHLMGYSVCVAVVVATSLIFGDGETSVPVMVVSDPSLMVTFLIAGLFTGDSLGILLLNRKL
jgi:hypothetical protein